MDKIVIQQLPARQAIGGGLNRLAVLDDGQGHAGDAALLHFTFDVVVHAVGVSETCPKETAGQHRPSQKALRHGESVTEPRSPGPQQIMGGWVSERSGQVLALIPVSTWNLEPAIGRGA